ncbi:MAG: hypothetical protein HY758_08605 [Nitrospirae bacterium]|nr:hypothetical protein [Nitrospirota bacterium]
MRQKTYVFAVISLISLLACFSSFPAHAASYSKSLPPEEQEQKALETFNSILSLSGSTDERDAVVKKREEKYSEIIYLYPKASVVEESYWRLIMIYLEDHYPRDYIKAETLFREFRGKHPDSPLENLIAESLAGSYYQDRMYIL